MKRTIIIISFMFIVLVVLYFFSRPDYVYEDGVVAYKKGNYEQAIMLLSISANKGNSTANVAVGEMYALGLGTEKNASKAMQYFERAKKKEALEMIRSISERYLHGDGVKKDLNESAYWDSMFNQIKKR